MVQVNFSDRTRLPESAQQVLADLGLLPSKTGYGYQELKDWLSYHGMYSYETLYVRASVTSYGRMILPKDHEVNAIASVTVNLHKRGTSTDNQLNHRWYAAADHVLQDRIIPDALGAAIVSYWYQYGIPKEPTIDVAATE
jgi:hypothetical protein